MNPLNAYANDRLAKAMKASLELKEISLEDLLKDDNHVYDLLRKSSSNEVLNLINSIGRDIKVVENKLDYDIYQKFKLRIIDPTVVINNEVFRISEKSKKATELTNRALAKSHEGIYIKIIT